MEVDHIDIIMCCVRGGMAGSDGESTQRRGEERLRRRFARGCLRSSNNSNRSESLSCNFENFSNCRKTNMCSNRVELWASCTNINFSSRRSKFLSFFNAPAVALRGVVKCRGHISFHALSSSLPPSLPISGSLSLSPDLNERYYSGRRLQ